MGTEGGASTKATKAGTSQEQQLPPPNTPYTEWAAAFQAYYGSGATPPPGYFPASVASGPQPHPYIWAGQPLMPYGTPHAALYPYGGIYAHPSMPPGAHPFGQYGILSPNTEIAMGTTANTEAEHKSLECKERNGIKRSKGSLCSLGMLTGKGSDGTKATSGSMNGHTQSGDSDGSSERSEETTQNGSQPSEKGSHDQLSIDGSYATQGGDAYGGDTVGNSVNHANPTAMTGKPVAPTTNLNIGMDYWGGSTPSPLARGKRNTSGMSTALVPASPHTQLMGAGRDGVPGELWLQLCFCRFGVEIGSGKSQSYSYFHMDIFLSSFLLVVMVWEQDERELKRQRRKQSNRESARRSRLRKQAECEELNTRVDTLTVENMALRTELSRLAEQSKKLSAANDSLLEQLRRVQGGGDAATEEEGEEQQGNWAFDGGSQKDLHQEGQDGENNSCSRREEGARELVCETADRAPPSQLECGASASHPVEAVAAG